MHIHDLVKAYQAKTDEELLQLAMASEQLTTEPQAVLTGELARRRINIAKQELAVHMYQLALAASPDPSQMKETQTRLQHLGDIRQTLRIVAAGGGELSNMRTTKVVRIVSSSTAEFFILFGPGAKIEDIKFISGSDSLKSAGKVLSSTHFNLEFPDEGPTRLLRRGVLGCYQYSGCSIVLINPADVHSVN
jgi:hypothetical protein